MANPWEVFSESQTASVMPWDIFKSEAPSTQEGAKPWEVYAEGGIDKEEVLRKEYEALPSTSLKELASMGLATSEGRVAFRDKVKKEYEAEEKKLSPKQRDKFYSNADFYMKAKYPKEYSAFMGLDIPERLMAMSGDMPLALTNEHSSSNGFVYSDNPNRAYINATGDVRTIAHETEHVKQHEVSKKNPNHYYNNAGSVGEYNSPLSKFKRLASDNKEDPTFKEVFRAANSFDGMNEFLANIAGYEVTLPIGTSLLDTPLYKKVSEKVGEKKAKEMFDAAIANTNVGRDRLAESTFEFKKKIDSNESYAKQLYLYLKGKFE